MADSPVEKRLNFQLFANIAAFRIVSFKLLSQRFKKRNLIIYDMVSIPVRIRLR